MNKIDKINCTFKDNDLEKKYLDDKWEKVSSFYSYVLIVMIIGVGLLLISLYLRGTFAIKNILVPASLFIITIFISIPSNAQCNET